MWWGLCFPSMMHPMDCYLRSQQWGRPESVPGTQADLNSREEAKKYSGHIIILWFIVITITSIRFLQPKGTYSGAGLKHPVSLSLPVTKYSEHCPLEKLKYFNWTWDIPLMLPLPLIESSSTFWGSTLVKIAISVKNISFSSCNLQPLNIYNHQYLCLKKKTT